MPRLDGLELAHCIRSNDRLKQTPIVMLTSRTNQQHRLRAEQIGVNRYLVKPQRHSETQSLHITMIWLIGPTKKATK